MEAEREGEREEKEGERAGVEEAGGAGAAEGGGTETVDEVRKCFSLICICAFFFG